MKYKVAIGVSSFAAHDDFPERLLIDSGIEIVPNPFGRRLTEDETVEHLKDVDGLIAGLEPLNRRVLSACSSLKALARVGIGMDNVDEKAAREFGVKVSNTPDGPTDSVVELCLAAFLAIGRKLIQFNTDLHQGIWKKRIGFGIRNTKVLLVGYGRIGRRFGEVLTGLGAKILVCDPAVDKDSLSHGEELVSLSQGLSEAQVVSLHASGIETILGSEQFDVMRQGMIVLNSARGGLIEEQALVQALENETVAAAWLDAFPFEPYKGELMHFDQVLLTPHISTYSVQCRRAMEERAVRNLLMDLGVKSAY